MGATSQYQNLIEKLDQFIRKYYTNEWIRGGIFAVIYVLLFFLVINILSTICTSPRFYAKYCFMVLYSPLLLS